jgi:outer membrane protein OmpA-like peptidoglycan-associated protein
MRSSRVLCACVALATCVAFVPSSAPATGASLDGMRGLLRVPSADPHAVGYLAGTFWGSYSRVQYEASESPNGRPETVKFGGSSLAVTFAPASMFELALRGSAETQFLDSAPASISERKFGLHEIGLGAKALITPESRQDFRVAALLDVGTTLGNREALAGSWDSDGFDILGRLALTYSAPAAEGRKGLRAHATTGYLNRTGAFDEAAWAATAAGPTPSGSVLHGDQFRYGAGVEIPAPRGWTAFAEWSGEYDVQAEAAFSDNPMRITPGVRWSAPGDALVFTAGADVSLASEEAGPSWGLLAGFSFAGHMAPVRGTLLGTVRDADTGEPIANARVAARDGGATAVTDASGRFRAEVKKGYAVVEVSADGYVTKTRVVEVPAHRTQDFDFTLPKRNVLGALGGNLRNASTGAALAGRVRVQGGEWVAADSATGKWTIAEVTEGEVVLEFEAPGHRTGTATAVVKAGETVVRDAVLVADPKADHARIEGVVRDAATGRPIDATITAQGKTTATARTDPATGRYELRMEAGDYTVSAAGAGYAGTKQSVTVASRDARVLDWKLADAPRQLTLHGVRFDSGGATIKRESLTALEAAAKFLADNPGANVLVQGHTDETGSAEGNVALSQRRADAVLKYLVVNYGVDPARLAAKGLGAQAPVAPNDTEENRARNRRIELVVEGAN